MTKDPNSPPTYTAEEVEQLVESRVQERLRGTPGDRQQVLGARPQHAPSHDTNAMLAQFLQLKMAEAIGGGARPAEVPQPMNATPASNRGAPPATSGPDIADFVHWPEADRKAFLADKGPLAYRQALNRSLRGRSIRTRG